MKIIGHRGAKGLAPENTIAAFRKALEHGVFEIECDARTTSDGIVVLEHDAKMRDAAGKQYQVNKYTYDQLLRYKPDLVTLAQAVGFVKRRVPVMIEVKPKVDVVPILDYIKQMRRQGYAVQDLTLASEDFGILKTAHEELPDLELSVIESWSGVRATWKARRLGIKRLSMNYRSLWVGFTKPLVKRGYVISAYTVNDKRTARRLEKDGVQCIFTDVPDIFEPKQAKA